MEKKLFINGMMCAHCVKHVKDALEKTEGVANAEVSLEGKFAVAALSKDVPAEALKKAVEEAGYEVTGIE